MDREKSGQFKGLLLYFKRHGGVKETDEPLPPPFPVPPGSGALNSHWENRARGGEPTGGGEEGGINLRGGGNRSFLPPPFPALSHLQGAEKRQSGLNDPDLVRHK